MCGGQLPGHVRDQRPESVLTPWVVLRPGEEAEVQAEEDGGQPAGGQLLAGREQRVGAEQEGREEEVFEAAPSLLKGGGAVQLLELRAAEARPEQVRRPARAQVRILVRGLLSP